MSIVYFKFGATSIFDGLLLAWPYITILTDSFAYYVILNILKWSLLCTKNCIPRESIVFEVGNTMWMGVPQLVTTSVCCVWLCVILTWK